MASLSERVAALEKAHADDSKILKLFDEQPHVADILDRMRELEERIKKLEADKLPPIIVKDSGKTKPCMR